MSASLIATCIIGGTRRDVVLPDWVDGDEVVQTVLAIAPNRPACLLNEFPDLLPPMRWKNKEVYLLPILGAVVNPVSKWKSDSRCSGALYPSYCCLSEVDFVWQIMPQGMTSEHYHAEEEGSEEVCEIIAPIFTDGKTCIWLEGEESPRVLKRPASILFGQAHQLVRRASGLSVNILKMCSRKYRFPCREGHIKCNRLRH